MKSKFSTKWKASKQPRKQRKYLANAPLHLRKKFVNVNLSKELRKKYPKEGHKQNKRNIQIKKGDKVKIMRGEFRGQTGKVLEVNIKKSLIVIEGIQAKKRDGSKVNIKLQPSNLQIIELSERLKKTQTESKQEVSNRSPKTSNENKQGKKPETQPSPRDTQGGHENPKEGQDLQAGDSGERKKIKNEKIEQTGVKK